ncbi:MAG: hypothetical protein ABI583_00515 [Betaproteobacteria bacterium]
MAKTGLLRDTFAQVALSVIVGTFALTAAHAQDAVRPEIGKPLQAAAALMKANKFKEALTKIHEVDAVSGKSPNEIYLIESTRGSAASGARDNDTMIKSFEAVIASGRAPAATQIKIIEALVGAHYYAKDYAATNKWATRYLREGGSNPQIRTLLIQSYFQAGDYANSAKESLADIQVDEKAGRTPSEEKLQLLANSYLRQKNSAGYISTIEKLLNYYPKKSLWVDVISRLQRKPGFSDRLAIDVYRLQLVTGNLSSKDDYMLMPQLALQAGYPGEAKKVVDEGYANGALGKGDDVDRQKRLRDLVEKRVAENQKTISGGAEVAAANASKDGDALFSLGYNLFTSGQAAKGITMMEAAIKKGDLKRPDDAKLRLGTALIQSGQKAKGVQVLKTVQGNDGTQDLANLWTIFAR